MTKRKDTETHDEQQGPVTGETVKLDRTSQVSSGSDVDFGDGTEANPGTHGYAGDDQEFAGSELSPAADPFADPDERTTPIVERSSDQSDEQTQEPIVIDYTIVLGDRSFTIEEPDILCIIGFVKKFGKWAIRSEGQVGTIAHHFTVTQINDKTGQKSSHVLVPSEALIAGAAASFELRDLIDFGVLALFGGSEKEQKDGLEWFKKIGVKQIKLGPILQACLFRFALSEDLRDAMGKWELANILFPMIGAMKASKTGDQSADTAKALSA